MEAWQIQVLSQKLTRGAPGRGRQVGRCHHPYASVLGGRRLSPTSAMNVVTTPSHLTTDLNVRVDAATQEPPEVDLTWLHRRPFFFLPPVTYGDPRPALPNSADQLVAGSGLHTGTGRL